MEDVAARIADPSYSEFKLLSPDDQRTTLIDIINLCSLLGLNNRGRWLEQERYARILLGLNAEKELKNRLLALNITTNNNLRKTKLVPELSSDDLEESVNSELDPKITAFVKALLLEDNCLTIIFLKQVFLPKPIQDPVAVLAPVKKTPPPEPFSKGKERDTPSPAAAAKGSDYTEVKLGTDDNNNKGEQSDIDESLTLKLLGGETLPTVLPQPSDNEDDYNEDGVLKHRAVILFNKAKRLAWEKRNYGQRTGEITFISGGAVTLFGLFAGSNPVISTGIAKILPPLFNAWSLSHGIPPAAMLFYLLGTLIGLAGLITFGASTAYQRYHQNKVLKPA